jgi:hypothetical protein
MSHQKIKNLYRENKYYKKLISRNIEEIRKLQLSCKDTATIILPKKQNIVRKLQLSCKDTATIILPKKENIERKLQLSCKDTATIILSKKENKKQKKERCVNEQDILKQFKMCKELLYPQAWSVLLEKSIKKRFDIKPAKSEISGDGIHHKLKNVEIKVSLGGGDDDNKFNFVQLRPHHDLDYYLFFLYNKQLDEVNCLKIEPKVIYNLLPTYGGYAHGTVKLNGKITLSNISNNTFEYALRPTYNINGLKKSDTLWRELIKYKIDISELL